MKKILSQVYFVRCKNCAQVITTSPERTNRIEQLVEEGHKVTVEENSNKPRCAGKVCYEKEGIEQLNLQLN